MNEKEANSKQLLAISNFFHLPRHSCLKSQGLSQGAKCEACVHWMGVCKSPLCVGTVLCSRG